MAAPLHGYLHYLLYLLLHLLPHYEPIHYLNSRTLQYSHTIQQKCHLLEAQLNTIHTSSCYNFCSIKYNAFTKLSIPLLNISNSVISSSVRCFNFLETVHVTLLYLYTYNPQYYFYTSLCYTFILIILNTISTHHFVIPLYL